MGDFEARDKIKAVVNLLGVTQNTNNYGVRVLLSAAVECLAETDRQLEIRILDYERKPAVWSESTESGQKSIPLVNLRFSWRVHLPNNIFRLLLLAAISRFIPNRRVKERLLLRNPWLAKIFDARVNLSLSGGDSFSDIYGLGRFFYVALPQLLVVWLNRPLVFLPQTFGPYKHPVSRRIAQYILRRAQAIYSRDAEGVETVKKLVGPKQIPITMIPDLGFIMKSESLEESLSQQVDKWRTARPIVGMNISKLLYMGGYSGKNMFGLREDYRALISQLLTYLVSDLQTSVLLIPHVYCEGGEGELALCRQLAAEFGERNPGVVHFFDTWLNHREIKELIRKCDVFVGSRMHACIAAASQCVPTVALAYSDKFGGVMTPMRDGVRVVDLRRADIHETCAAVGSALAKRVKMRQSAEKEVPGIKNSIRALFKTPALRNSLLETTDPSGG